jgi:muramoyltetrapeptide carboxypeptidase
MNLPAAARGSHSLSESVKPPALVRGAKIAVISPSSPSEAGPLAAGLAELRRLGYAPDSPRAMQSEGYFAASASERREELLAALADPSVRAVIATRGGYGANYLLDGLPDFAAAPPKCLLGFSDLTSLQIFLWQRARWVTFYGPMVAAGFAAGDAHARGYDAASFLAAVEGKHNRWTVALGGEALQAGQATGRLLGGCLTMIQAGIGTPWELDTRGSILLLEDRGMRPYQVDRALLHLLQAGKFESVRGIVLGDFPECEPPLAGSPSVRDVCRRLLGDLRAPAVFGARVGHTARPMLTVPLGVRAALRAEGEGQLEFLESAVSA